MPVINEIRLSWIIRHETSVILCVATEDLPIREVFGSLLFFIKHFLFSPCNSSGAFFHLSDVSMKHDLLSPQHFILVSTEFITQSQLGLSTVNLVFHLEM